MKQISKDEIKKWQVEIEEAEDFREDNFGTNEKGKEFLAGDNIGFYDFGMSSKLMGEHELVEPLISFNIVGPIVDFIVPTLSAREPYVISMPKRNKEADSVSAPIAGEILNYRYKEIDLKRTNEDVIWDAYVLGMGVSKIGYTTKFGTAPTEDTIKAEDKDRKKSKLQKLKETLGIAKEKKEEVRENPELDEFIRSESPFVKHVSPFNFGIDPRATSIENANFVYEKVVKRLSDVKKDKTYKNTSKLKGFELEDKFNTKVPETQLDRFKLIRLYEIHYKTDEGINILTLAESEGEAWKELRHDESVYEMDGFQYEVLYFKKHRHKLYPISDISKIKGIQNRIQDTLESILDQVDKYSPKLVVDETALTPSGKGSLEEGDTGAIVYANRDPNTVIKEANFTQLKADLLALIDRTLDIAMFMTGLTKSQLLGITPGAQTATEIQVGQAGSNLRLSDKFDAVNDFLNRQVRKLWQVEKQFTDFEEIDLIIGEQTIDERGLPKYSFIDDIDSSMSEKLAKGEYRFTVEVASKEKAELPILRKALENFVNIIGGEGVLDRIEAKEGVTVVLSEVIREWMKLHPDMFKIPGKVLRPISPQQQQAQQLQAAQAAQGAQGQGVNPQQRQANAPNTADIISAAAGENAGGGTLA